MTYKIKIISLYVLYIMDSAIQAYRGERGTHMEELLALKNLEHRLEQFNVEVAKHQKDVGPCTEFMFLIMGEKDEQCQGYDATKDRLIYLVTMACQDDTIKVPCPHYGKSIWRPVVLLKQRKPQSVRKMTLDHLKERLE